MAYLPGIRGHPFAVFLAAIVAVPDGAYPLLTPAMLAVAAAVLSGTFSPALQVRVCCLS
jgi:hypothetical protein